MVLPAAEPSEALTMETIKRFRLVMTKNGSIWPMFTGEQFLLEEALFRTHPTSAETESTDG